MNTQSNIFSHTCLILLTSLAHLKNVYKSGLLSDIEYGGKGITAGNSRETLST
jgi:hypothetical protein